jgi:Glycosyltransferase family 87
MKPATSDSGMLRQWGDARGAALLALPAVALFVVVLAIVRGEWWSGAIAVAVLLLALHAVDADSPTTRAFGWVATAGGAVAIIATFGPNLVATAIDGVLEPPQWDFQYFWIYGRVAAEGLDFYQFERAHELARTFFGSPDDFFLELYFWYPPPTMFMFLPLALFEVHVAAALWYVFLGLALAGSAILLSRLFLGSHRWLGFVVALAMIVALNPTRLTVLGAQTNFVALLLTLLVFADRSRARSGMWLVLGGVVKPVVAVTGLAFLLRRRWNVVAATLGTGIALVVASGVVFGVQTLVTYLTDNPAARHAPDFLWFQGINQSLLAATLRWTGTESGGVPFANPVFLVIASLIILASCIVMAVRGVVSEEHALALAVPLGLIVYPGTLSHYQVLLLVPLGYLWTQRNRIRLGQVWVAGLTGLTILLMDVSGSEASLLAAGLVWAVLVGTGLTAVLVDRWLEPVADEASPRPEPVPTG